MEEFNRMYERQKEFQNNFFNIDSFDRIRWTKEFILCLHQELAEIMNSVDWKTYHNYLIVYDDKETQEEIVDAFKFLLNLMIIWDITPDILVALFNQKSNIVEQRLKIKSNGEGNI